MAVEASVQEKVVSPQPDEEADLVELDREIKEILSKDGETARLVSVDGHEIEVPASALHALELVVDGMAHGRSMILLSQGQELTTQQAADLLRVSRPHLIKLLDEGEIPHHRVGSHRRVRIEDMLAYRQRRNARRREALERLTRLSEEAPSGYS